MVTSFADSELANRLGAFLSALPSDPASLFEREFRTPLNALLASAAVLAEDMGAITPEQARERVSALHRRALLLHLVAEDIFCATAIAEDRLYLHRQEIELSELLAEASAAASPLLRYSAQWLETSGDMSTARVLIDTRRIGQVLLTLIHAVGDEADDGSALEIRAEAERRIVRMEVSSRRLRAPGGPPRLPALPTEASGLGIGVARSIVHAHGCAFGEPAEPSTGSSFPSPSSRPCERLRQGRRARMAWALPPPRAPDGNPTAPRSCPRE